MKKKIRVVMVDDHPLFRKGIYLYLEDITGIEVIKECSEGQEALNYLEKHNELVNVIIMDLEMPNLDGAKATEKICNMWPEVKILVLTSYGSWDRVYSLLSSGAAGYLLKDTDPKELIVAIRAVNSGGSYFDQRIAEKLMNRVQKNESKKQVDFIEPLTNREIEVLTQIGEGLSNSEIAEKLHISDNTVKTHVSNIMQKLNAKSRTQAAFYGIRAGLIE